MRRGTSLGNELRRILGRGFEAIDELTFALLLILAFFVLFATEIEGTLFAELSFVLFLFFESLDGLFFALDVEFDQSSIFGAICLYSGLRLNDVNVVYQVESYGSDSVAVDEV